MEFIATAGETVIKIHTMIKNKKVNDLKGFASPINKLIFHPNNWLIAGGTVSGVIHIWNVNNGQMIATLKPHQKQITDIIIHPKFPWLISSSADGKIAITDLNTKTQKHLISVSKHPITDIDLFRKSMTLASVTSNGNIGIWDIEDGDDIDSWKDKKTKFKSVQFLNSDEKLITLDMNGVIKFWDDEELVNQFDTGYRNDLFLVKTENQSRIIIGKPDEKVIEVLNTKNWSIANSFSSKSHFNSLTFTSDKLFLYTRHEKSVRTWPADFLLSDKKKITLYVSNKLDNWLEKKEKETASEYKIRVSNLNKSEKIEEWTQKAIQNFGKKKYKFTKNRIIQTEVDPETNVVRLFSKDIKPIYLKVSNKVAKNIKEWVKKVVIKKAEYVFADNQIQLFQAVIAGSNFIQAYKYNIEDELVFKNKKIKTTISKTLPKLKL
jgi:WD40 repeat protein